jgi:hypothetical protein
MALRLRRAVLCDMDAVARLHRHVRKSACIALVSRIIDTAKRVPQLDLHVFQGRGQA